MASDHTLALYRTQRYRLTVPINLTLPWQELREWAEYIALRLIAFLLCALPLSAATFICAKAMRRAAPWWSPRRHRRALNNLHIAFPHLSEAERARICAAHWENVGRVVAASSFGLVAQRSKGGAI